VTTASCNNCRRPLGEGDSDFCSTACDLAADLEVKRLTRRLEALETERHRTQVAVRGLAETKREIRRANHRLLELLARA